MGYAYLLHEDVGIGTRRILFEEVERAETELRRKRNKVVAVHEGRKSIKRIRALLRLIKTGLRKSEYRAVNDGFRDLNRRLAHSRDLDVMHLTLSRLEATNRLSGSGTAKRVREAIRAAEAEMHRLDSKPPIKQALVTIEKLHGLVADLDLRRINLSVLIDGLGRSMSNFSAHYDMLSSDADAETYHEWRKAVQIHRRHVSLLRAAWPESLQPRAAVSKQLSECLGFDHDLAVLISFVSGPRGRPVTKRDVTKLSKIAATHQDELRRQARAIGALLSAEPPEAFRSRIQSYWRVRRDFAGELNSPLPSEAVS